MVSCGHFLSVRCFRREYTSGASRNTAMQATLQYKKTGFLTRGERHFRHLSVDAMMLADPKPQLAVPTGHPGVSLEALAVAYGVDLASSVWAGG